VARVTIDIGHDGVTLRIAVRNPSARWLMILVAWLALAVFLIALVAYLSGSTGDGGLAISTVGLGVVCAVGYIQSIPRILEIDERALRVVRRPPGRPRDPALLPLADVTRFTVVRERRVGPLTIYNSVHARVRGVGSVPVITSAGYRSDAERIRDALNAHLAQIREAP
jgi:hypothetical protein